MEAEKQKRLKQLEDQHRETVATIDRINGEREKLNLERTMWLTALGTINDQIAVLNGVSEPEVEELPDGSTRRIRGSGFKAEQAIHDKLKAEPGRKFTAAELEPIAGGHKVRLLVYRWNMRVETLMTPGRFAISMDGDNKGRTYFIGK